MIQEHAIRSAVFEHLARLNQASPSGISTSAEINSFEFLGRPIRLIVQSGIRKLQGYSAALTIRTTFTPPTKLPPYMDSTDGDGIIQYKYRGIDPNHSDNRALRQAMDDGLPLAYFVGIGRGLYLSLFPVFIVGENVSRHEFAVGLDESMCHADTESLDALQREYIARLTNHRLHQPVFRARVLYAYNMTCAICRLRHPELLDAAHIIPDGHVRGEPVVPNGLSLCKIHHAAFDHNFVGISPEGIVEVQSRLLNESDGPMLRHGIQEIAGTRILLPKERSARPDRDRLAERYEEFRRAC